MLKDNSTVRTAMAEFLKLHPDATVNLEVAMDDESAQNADDAIRSLNTRILAGDGPDVIILDDCPADSYAEKGMLLDLTDKISLDGLYEPVKDALAGADGTYYVAARMKIPMLFGSSDSLSGISTLQDFVEAVQNGKDMPVQNPAEDSFASIPEEERPAIAFTNLQEAYTMLWNASAGAILPDNKLDKEQLKVFLEALKAISDKYGLADLDGEAIGGAMAMAGIGSDTTVIQGSPIAYVSQRAHMGAATVDNILTSNMVSQDDTQYATFPGLTQGTWIPSTVAGVSAGTKVEDLAVEFIQLMLSKEVQMVSSTGFPVLKEGADAQIAELDRVMKENGNDGFEYDMDATAAQLKTAVMVDSVLTDKIWEVVPEYCKGNIDLEGAVSKIEQETQNYLAERA